MAQVTVKINGYTYTVGCEDGQEEHLNAMSAQVESRVESIKALGSQSGEARLLVLASLLMADELHDLRAEIERARASFSGVGVTEQAILAPPFIPNDNPKFIGYHLATMRYRLNGSAVYLATLQPANLGLKRPLNIGQVSGDLGNGRQAYVGSSVLREGPKLETRRTFNQVSFVENGLIVVVSSELPAEQLFVFAKDALFTGQK